MTMKKEELLDRIARSCWIVPIFFYALIPALLERLPDPVVLVPALLALIVVLLLKWRLYQRDRVSTERYLLDMSFFAAGVAVLYCAVTHVFGDAGYKNDFLYICCYLTNVPAVVRVKRMNSSFSR